MLSKKGAENLHVALFMRQVICIPMGTNCACFVAAFYLYTYESDFINQLVDATQHWDPGRRVVAASWLCLHFSVHR